MAACLTMILRMTTHITRFVNFQLSNEAEGLFGGEKMMTSYIFFVHYQLRGFKFYYLPLLVIQSLHALMQLLQKCHFTF